MYLKSKYKNMEGLIKKVLNIIKRLFIKEGKMYLLSDYRRRLWNENLKDKATDST